MTFRIPKGMTIAATGDRVSESTDGSHNVTAICLKGRVYNTLAPKRQPPEAGGCE